MMELTKVLANLKIENPPESWGKKWKTSAESYQPGEVKFLSESFISSACDKLGMSTEVKSVMLEGLTYYREKPEAERLAWHCHWEGFIDKNYAAMNAPYAGDDAPLGARLFDAYVDLSGLPYIKEEHAKRGIPWEITLDTLSDLELWINENKKYFGVYGLRAGPWNAKHFTSRIFKLGRLQFDPDIFHQPFRAYHNANDGKVAVLADPGLKFRADGHFICADNGSDPNTAFASVLEEKEGKIVGNLADPKRGVIYKTPITLDATKWQEIIQKGDPSMSVHIPATGSMTLELCGASFRMALNFFPKYFPELEFKAFWCHSWLLDPQLGSVLPDKSNVVKFLREWYLMPGLNASDSQTIERIFGFHVKKLDVDSAPQESSLQRAIIKHMKSGGRWRDGAGIIFKNPFDYGNQPYFNQNFSDIMPQ